MTEKITEKNKLKYCPDMETQRAKSPAFQHKHRLLLKSGLSKSYTTFQRQRQTSPNGLKFPSKLRKSMSSFSEYRNNEFTNNGDDHSNTASRNNSIFVDHNAISNQSRSLSPYKHPNGKIRSRTQLSKAYYHKKKTLTLNEGEVFSPFLWKKFHIDEHMFDVTTPDEDNKLTSEEIQDNIEQVKLKYPHLTKYYKADGQLNDYSPEDKRQRVFDKRLAIKTTRNNSDILWQRHVDMIQSSKSTSYYSFLTDYDRQSCRTCSHSKSCTSKHCKSCDCETKCERHTINVDFLKYRIMDQYDGEEEEGSEIQNSMRRVSQHSAPVRKHLQGYQVENNNRKNNTEGLDNGIGYYDDRNDGGNNDNDGINYGLRVQGFTIMPKTANMERKTLLSSHIDGYHCTFKSGHKKCLACAMGKENVLMQNSKRFNIVSHPKTKSAPARIRRSRSKSVTL